jgi:hypothetical protein
VRHRLPGRLTIFRTKAATILAACCAAIAVAGCGSDKVTDQDHKDFVKGCTDGGAPADGCECLYTELVDKQGIDTEKELQDLQDKLDKAGSGSVPEELQKAFTACQSKLTGS